MININEIIKQARRHDVCADFVKLYTIESDEQLIEFGMPYFERAYVKKIITNEDLNSIDNKLLEANGIYLSNNNFSELNTYYLLDSFSGNINISHTCKIVCLSNNEININISSSVYVDIITYKGSVNVQVLDNSIVNIIGKNTTFQVTGMDQAIIFAALNENVICNIQANDDAFVRLRGYKNSRISMLGNSTERHLIEKTEKSEINYGRE